MASIISAGTTSGTSLNLSGDTSGVLQLASNGSTTAVTIDTNQRAAFVAGTAALPAITTTGDTNTGIFFPAADTIAFSEGGTEAMRIDGSGNVGIGTSPIVRLDVDNSSTSGTGIVTTGRLHHPGTAFADGPRLLFTAGSSTTGGCAIAGSGTALNAADMLFYAGGNTERMRITASGQLFVFTTTDIISGALDNVQIGCTAPSGSIQYGMMIGGNATTYTVNAIRFVNTYTPAVVGTITIGSSSTAYNTSSDYRLKENIAPMTGALGLVQQLKPVTYNWKSDGSSGQGFIAHELQAIVPDCVTGEKDAIDEEGNPVHQGVDTSFLVATLTAAIQELKAELDATKAEVQALKGTL